MDPLNDPRFPDRPDHPDFWLLVERINYIDGQATEGGKNFEDLMREFIDPESVVYMADQRIMRAIMTNAPPQEIVMALYMDGFALGYLTALKKGNTDGRS